MNTCTGPHIPPFLPTYRREGSLRSSAAPELAPWRLRIIFEHLQIGRDARLSNDAAHAYPFFGNHAADLLVARVSVLQFRHTCCCSQTGKLHSARTERGRGGPFARPRGSCAPIGAGTAVAVSRFSSSSLLTAPGPGWEQHPPSTPRRMLRCVQDVSGSLAHPSIDRR
ncbi:hypothetical protein BDV95DRAFT_169199 [Massariosphaeria phaeospora]|uniref:Uncharacterized protein n=1 Tax=Massariosphaeria phaeospora TaxID=100035 RepID=A0A7C8M3Z2_9PLEO|nr:hypothetical protein BDV95DRAFT_169199 [Massariosphaeria phaeospora]